MKWGARFLLAAAVAVGVWAFRGGGRFSPDLVAALSPYYVDQALETLAAPGGEAISVAPFCFRAGADGIVQEVSRCAPFIKARSRWDICGFQNISPKGWDPAILNAAPERLAERLVPVLSRHSCRTLLIDVESLEASDRDRFTVWARELVGALRARIPGLKSWVALHAKTEEPGTWNGARAQDWKALCRDHDELVVMAYDYHLPGVTPPGETAPLEWVGRVLDFGLSVCPAGKVRLGLAAYGYAWPSRKVVTEREAAITARPFVESWEQRALKQELARRKGVSRFLLWALGMERGGAG